MTLALIVAILLIIAVIINVYVHRDGIGVGTLIVGLIAAAIMLGVLNLK